MYLLYSRNLKWLLFSYEFAKLFSSKSYHHIYAMISRDYLHRWYSWISTMYTLHVYFAWPDIGMIFGTKLFTYSLIFVIGFTCLQKYDLLQSTDQVYE